jgi:hypothetical protein
VKRVICGLQAEGPSTILGIEELPDLGERASRGLGLQVKDVWATDGPSLATEDLTERPGSITEVPIGGTRFRLVTFPGGAAGENAVGMHKTETIDYGLVIEGEIDLVMEDGSEVAVFPGDCVVQLGAVHLWRRRNEKPTTVAFVMIGAE